MSRRMTHPPWPSGQVDRTVVIEDSAIMPGDKTCVIGGGCSNTEGTGVAAKGTHDC